MKRIHDLETLLQEIIKKDSEFKSFLTPIQRITEYYVETRYPMGIYSDFKKDALVTDLELVRQLHALIMKKTKV